MKKTPMMLSVAAALAVAGVTPTVARDFADPIVQPAQAKTVVDVAVGSPDHTTLVSAVQAAGLVETLSRRSGRGVRARSPSSRRPTRPSPGCRRRRCRPPCARRTAPC
jgi:Secreted and surface protein containing fasciclin-like repeats